MRRCCSTVSRGLRANSSCTTKHRTVYQVHFQTRPLASLTFKASASTKTADPTLKQANQRLQEASQAPSEPEYFPSDDTILKSEIEVLLTRPRREGLPCWTLTADRRGLQKRIYFKGFKPAIEFLVVLSDAIIQRKYGMTAKHHPEWLNVYNWIDITWTTHKHEAITTHDVKMAKLTDNFAIQQGGYESEAAGKQFDWKREPHNPPNLRKEWRNKLAKDAKDLSGNETNAPPTDDAAQDPR